MKLVVALVVLIAVVPLGLLYFNLHTYSGRVVKDDAATAEKPQSTSASRAYRECVEKAEKEFLFYSFHVVSPHRPFLRDELAAETTKCREKHLK